MGQMTFDLDCKMLGVYRWRNKGRAEGIAYAKARI